MFTIRQRQLHAHKHALVRASHISYHFCFGLITDEVMITQLHKCSPVATHRHHWHQESSLSYVYILCHHYWLLESAAVLNTHHNILLHATTLYVLSFCFIFRFHLSFFSFGLSLLCIVVGVEINKYKIFFFSIYLLK